MMKKYLVGGIMRQFEEGKQPEGAVEVTAKAPEKAAEKPANKAAKPANKSRKAARK